jgi:hypothetical protein
MTINPSITIEDGPYVVIGTSEFSLLEALAGLSKSDHLLRG